MTHAEAKAMVGHDVIYRRPSGGDDQRGVITSVDDVFVYVRYAGDDHPKATSPDHLIPVTAGS